VTAETKTIVLAKQSKHIHHATTTVLLAWQTKHFIRTALCKAVLCSHFL